jgi:MraZ protein
LAFRGTFDYSLDAKNRLTVPAKFRAALADGLVVAKGLERCVMIWRPSDYDGFTDQAVQGFHRVSPQGRKLRAFFSANSLDAELDAAGRVGIPPFLMEHAGLGKEVVVVGAEDNLQVWDRARWAEYNSALTDEIAEITSLLGQTAS